jgi:acetyl-CoA carboxylase carboxyl transferase subunit alpha
MADDKHLLDFEKPLVELEEKLSEMRELNAETQDDLSNEINALEERVEKLRTSIYRNLTRWQRVQIARHPERPYTLDYIEALTDDFLELHGDRRFSDDRSIVGGLARFSGGRYGYEDRTVMMIGHQKGRDTKERKYRRFGMPNPEGYRAPTPARGPRSGGRPRPSRTTCSRWPACRCPSWRSSSGRGPPAAPSASGSGTAS